MTVTLIHNGESWWWDRNRCLIECSNGEKVDPRIHLIPNFFGMTWEVHESREGIEGRYFACSSGGGKQFLFSKLLIPKSEYHQVVHTGKEPNPPSADILAFVKRENGW